MSFEVKTQPAEMFYKLLKVFSAFPLKIFGGWTLLWDIYGQSWLQLVQLLNGEL